MGPFPNSEGCKYILVAIDYVSKWVKALPCRATNAMHTIDDLYLALQVHRIVNVTLH
jgi:hypothetical protein